MGSAIKRIRIGKYMLQGFNASRIYFVNLENDQQMRPKAFESGCGGRDAKVASFATWS